MDKKKSRVLAKWFDLLEFMKMKATLKKYKNFFFYESDPLSHVKSCSICSQRKHNFFFVIRMAVRWKVSTIMRRSFVVATLTIFFFACLPAYKPEMSIEAAVQKHFTTVCAGKNKRFYVRVRVFVCVSPKWRLNNSNVSESASTCFCFILRSTLMMYIIMCIFILYRREGEMPFVIVRRAQTTNTFKSGK